MVGMTTITRFLTPDGPFRRVVALTMTCALAVGLLASCSDDADDETPSATVEGSSSASGDQADADLVAQYCAGVADIETFAGGVFEQLGEDATVDDELDAERQVAGYIEEQGYDQQQLPSEIDEDWQLFYEGFTTKLEPGNPQPTAEQQAAEDRLLAWEEANCTS
jgi:hypothetical protein